MKLTDVSIDNRTSVFVLIFAIIIAGVSSYMSLPREAAPDVQIPLIIVATPYFGVSPEDIESLVTQPIEKELNSISDVKEITSSSTEGFSNIKVEFDSGFDIDDALQKVRDKVNKAEKELPDDVEKPQIIELNFSEFPIFTFNISGPLGLVKLKDIAEDMKDEMENISGVLEVKISGGLEREVKVDVDINKLFHYNIRFDDVIDAIQNENKTIPGGSIDIGNSSFLVRVPGEFDRPYIIQDLIVKMKDGLPVYVKDVAKVEYAFADRSTYARLNGADCVTLNISKQTGSNIIEIADQLKDVISEYELRLPESVEFSVTVDQSNDIRRSVKNLENNIFSGLVLVLLVLFVLLGLRNATFVALAIPLSMLISFTVLSMLDITLNFVVLFALILALGMLVDNAIVVIENTYKFLEEGNDLLTAAKEGAKEVAWPITTSTLTTLMVFGPLMFWPGVIGDFMKYLPITLIVTLSASLFVALVINPVLASKYMKLEKKGEESNSFFGKIFRPIKKITHLFGDTLLPRTINAYEKQLAKVLGADRDPNTKVNKRNWLGLASIIPFLILYGIINSIPQIPPFVALFLEIVLGVGVILIFTNIRLRVLASSFMALIFIINIYGMFGHGIEFFPVVDPERVFVNIESPTGTNITASNRIARNIEKQLSKFADVDVKEYVANVGASNNQFDATTSTPNKSTITIQFVDFHNRLKSSLVTSDEIRDAIVNIAGAEVEVKMEEHGPPVGEPINVEIIGEDFDKLGNLSEDIRNKILTIDGVVDLKDDYDGGRPEIRIIIDREKAALYQMSTTIIANSIRTAINGFTASKYRINEEEYDIKVRLQKDQREDIGVLNSMRIVYNTKKGKTLSVPLISVATIEYTTGPGSIKRKDLKRVVTITGNVDASYNANEVLRKVKGMLANYDLPQDYRIGYGGQDEEQKKAEDFLSKAFMIGFLGIMMILVIQFNSFSQPLMIMIAVAISLVGVFIGLTVMAMPFGIIMTGIGVISLAGVVVNNNIVLIDYINILRKRGLSINQAALRAGIRRFRPVTLTAVTTILGLIPLTFGFGFDLYTFSIESGGADSAFWRPMGVAVIFGLLFGTILTLVVVPVMYSVFSDTAALFGRDRSS
ncbi:MAG: efflux RND transporter permease subunit [Melioribacteraceae bacterium]|nr:efflux RND transporter permease subunit [Melioribacteraceae bacterium]